MMFSQEVKDRVTERLVTMIEASRDLTLIDTSCIDTSDPVVKALLQRAFAGVHEEHELAMVSIDKYCSAGKVYSDLDLLATSSHLVTEVFSLMQSIADGFDRFRRHIDPQLKLMSDAADKGDLGTIMRVAGIEFNVVSSDDDRIDDETINDKSIRLNPDSTSMNDDRNGNKEDETERKLIESILGEGDSDPTDGDLSKQDEDEDIVSRYGDLEDSNDLDVQSDSPVQGKDEKVRRRFTDRPQTFTDNDN